jgi:hypothetical protein
MPYNNGKYSEEYEIAREMIESFGGENAVIIKVREVDDSDDPFGEGIVTITEYPTNAVILKPAYATDTAAFGRKSSVDLGTVSYKLILQTQLDLDYFDGDEIYHFYGRDHRKVEFTRLSPDGGDVVLWVGRVRESVNG